ncbi:hypothetical protein [Corallincola spongiicola]|uniref:Uncharacterized protein n=1 Tax=Corallincola spongiicola TaxID=2520508 RepID=A0ABY1WQ16_9GAMM|nr:hypothetical protein [Corallincola spongiicola]TAA46791.1 hypothetical protein EXY25_05930 [Corallincola spongiicola]
MMKNKAWLRKNQGRLSTMLSLSVVALGCVFCGAVAAIPQVDGLSTGGEELKQGTRLTLSGSGFGVKEQAAPKLYDRGDVAYENGVPNFHQKEFADGAEILRPDEDPETIWTKSSNYTYGKPPILTRSRPHRTAYLDSHYYMDGPKGYLGWPSVISEDNSVFKQEKFYFSWWTKVKAHPHNYYQYYLSERQGEFIIDKSLKLGEEVILSNGKTGRILEIDVLDDGSEIIHIDIDGAKRSDEGATITGIKSGAKAILFDRYKDPGSNKFTRIWDNPKGDALRYSWTNDGMKGMSGESATDWIGQARKWVHMEVYGDLTKYVTLAWVDQQLNHEVPMVEMKNDPEYSANIGLVGLDGKVQTYQETEVSELYFDYSPQRIMLGNAPLWEDVTHAEIQFPLAWSQNSVQFDLDLGSFEQITGGLYLYVFDDNNVNNAIGKRLCVDCKAPPSPAQ